MSPTKIAIIQGTLGRRLTTERFRLKAMADASDMRGLSYQAGLVAGLAAALKERDELRDVLICVGFYTPKLLRRNGKKQSDLMATNKTR